MKKLHKFGLPALIMLAGFKANAQAPETGTETIDAILTFWPFVVVLVLLLLAVLWYQNLRNMRRSRQSGRQRPMGANPIILLGLVSVFVVVLLALPWFLNRLETKSEETQVETLQIAPENRAETAFLIEGMTCTGCENAIQNQVKSLPGIESVKADHIARQTTVVYDKTLVDEGRIIAAIAQTGYTVVGKHE